MIHATISGRLGADAEFKAVGENDVLNFRVACDHGRGDKKTTTWVRCALWGKRGEKLQEYLVKGQSVVVRGELWTEDYEGKTSVQLRVDEVELVGPKPEGRDDDRGRDRDRDEGRGRRDDDRGERGGGRRDEGRGGGGDRSRGSRDGW